MKLLLALLPLSAWAASITSGTISAAFQNDGPLHTVVTLAGADFSISMQAAFGADDLIKLPLSCSVGTCTYDFSQLASLSHGSAAGLYIMSVTYHGATYEYGSTPYTLALSLNLTGSSVTVPGDFTPAISRLLFTWAGVPFTAAGTFAVMDGSTVILSDTLTGGGTAGAFEGQYLAGSLFSATYDFQADYANAPEPAAFALAASGLAAIGARRRAIT